MQTLHYHPEPKKREKIALETMKIYAPVAKDCDYTNIK
jgi:(p)ppGpp synthase/HD superfamily hydrolase